MNVDLLDFFTRVAMDPVLVQRLAEMPSQNRLAASRSLARVAEEGLGYRIPPEDFFPLLNVPPTTTCEQEWDKLTAHVDMTTPVDPGDTHTLMTRIQIIVERQRIKVFEVKPAISTRHY